MKAPRECRNVARKLCIDSEKLVRQYSVIVRTVQRQLGPNRLFERDGSRSAFAQSRKRESYVAGMNTFRSLTSGLASFKGSGYYMYHPRYHETTLHFPQNVELRVLCSWNEYVPESYKWFGFVSGKWLLYVPPTLP